MKYLLYMNESNNTYPMVIPYNGSKYVLFVNYESYKDSLNPDGNYNGDGDILLSSSVDKDGFKLLGGIRVNKNHRNKGLGEFLVVETLKLLKQQGIAGIISTGNSRSELAERMWDRLKKRDDVSVAEDINKSNGRKVYRISLI